MTATEQTDFFVTLAAGYSCAGDADNTLRCLRRAAEMAAESTVKPTLTFGKLADMIPYL